MARSVKTETATRPHVIPGPVRVIGTAAALSALYFLVIAVAGHNPYYMQILSIAAINVIGAVSLNLINGFTGLFSIGHAGFLAIGAYTSGSLTVFLGFPFIPSIIMGGICAMAMGFVVGTPTLRLGGDYLAIATLGFGEIIRVVMNNIDKVGGPRGFTGIPPYSSFFWTYLFAVATVLIIINFVTSSHGRACKSIREDEIAARAMGINVTRYKVTVFVIGSFFAGVAGGLLVHTLQLAHPKMFGIMKSVDYLIMIVVGGYGSITGAIVAATLITGLTEALRFIQEWRMLVYGLLLIVVMLTRPQGLMGGFEVSFDRLAGLLGKPSADAGKQEGVK
ncbi:MAG: branched-chain amino acid ABC transporter permease [Bacillota bacterium]